MRFGFLLNGDNTKVESLESIFNMVEKNGHGKIVLYQYSPLSFHENQHPKFWGKQATLSPQAICKVLKNYTPGWPKTYEWK